MNKNLYLSLALIFALGVVMPADAKLTKEAHDLYQQACSYEYKSDYNTAIRIMQEALSINGEDAMLYTKLAGLYADVGNYSEALAVYKKAVKLRPNDAFIYISIGNILQTTGDYENAYNAFKHAQEIYPEYKYNYLNLANIEYFRKNYPSAIENYNTFLSAYPDHMEASENLANVYSLTKQSDKAVNIYENIYKKYPSAFKEYEKYGMALFDTKHYPAAAEMLEKALKDNADSENINARLALAYQNMGENNKSYDYYKKTFKLNPELVLLKFDYANLLGNMGKYDDAIAAYKEYIAAYPDDADAYRNLGIVYKKTDNNELALFNFEKSYSMDSSNVETKKELALAYHKKQDYVNALKYYNFALKSEPENMELLANKALTLHAMGNYVAAIELYKDILAKQSNERIEQNLSAAAIAYAYNLYEKQDYGQSILYFEDALEINNKEASAYYGLALANEKMGCTDMALSNYEKAASLAPGNLEYATSLARYRESCSEGVKEEVAMETASGEEISIVTTPAALEQPATYEVLVKNGDEAYKLHKYEEAIDYYTKAVVFNPSDPNTMLKIANIYKLLGNNDKALNFYDKIISLDNNNVDAYFNKGLVLASQKKFDDCINCFAKVIELSPEYPYAYYSLGMAYEQKGCTEKALEYYYLYTGIETDDKMLTIVNKKIKQLESDK